MFKCKLVPNHHVYDSMKGPKFDSCCFVKFDSIRFVKCGPKPILLVQILPRFEFIGRQNFHGGKKTIGYIAETLTKFKKKHGSDRNMALIANDKRYMRLRDKKTARTSF